MKYLLKCNTCAFEVRTSGPHKFNCVRGVKTWPTKGNASPGEGLLLDAYCPKCHTNVEIVIIEFQRQCNPWMVRLGDIKEEYISNYSGWIKRHNKKEGINTEFYNADVVKCPKCNTRAIFNYTTKCPKCNKSVMIGMPYSSDP